MLLTLTGADAQKSALAAILAARLEITANGEKLPALLQAIEPVPDQRRPAAAALRVERAAGRLHVRCRLFPTTRATRRS